MIPELKFSMSLLMNGPFPTSSDIAKTVIEAIVPDLTEILRM